MRATELGVTLDGSDQTDNIRRALTNLPAGELLEFGEGSITIRGEVTIPAHARGIISRGTTFKIDANETRSGFLWRNANGMIRGGRFISEGEYEHHEAIIHCLDPANLDIQGLRFLGAGEDTRIQKGAALLIRGREKPASEVNITDVGIRSKIGTGKDVPVPIRIDGRLDGNARTTWRSTHSALVSPIPASKVRVSHTTVDGGYYGVMFSGVVDSKINHCTLRNNTRGISMQDGSCRNAVHFNRIIDNVSAGIHLAYGSSYNEIGCNIIETMVAHGEGLLQAYVGSTHNRFFLNHTKVIGAGPKYHAYIGVQSSFNWITDNKFEGGWQRACIGIESDWDSKLPYPYHRAFNAPNDDGYASLGMRDNVLFNNMIDADLEHKLLFSEVNGHGNMVVHGGSYPVTTIGNPEIHLYSEYKHSVLGIGRDELLAFYRDSLIKL